MGIEKGRFVMGTIVEKTVIMDVDDWRKAAAEAQREAVSWFNGDAGYIEGRTTRLKNAAEMLRAADAFNGRANHLEMFGEVDTAVVDAWDLSDEMEGEDEEPIWPELSAKVREYADNNPKLLKMVEHIDRLHKLAVEAGQPMITRRQFEDAVEAE
jgi:hypothetical protein